MPKYFKWPDAKTIARLRAENNPDSADFFDTEVPEIDEEETEERNRLAEIAAATEEALGLPEDDEEDPIFRKDDAWEFAHLGDAWDELDVLPSQQILYYDEASLEKPQDPEKAGAFSRDEQTKQLILNQPGAKIAHYNNTMEYMKLGSSYKATYYDLKGNKLFEPSVDEYHINQQMAFQVDNHMTNIKVQVNLKEMSDTEKFQLQEAQEPSQDDTQPAEPPQPADPAEAEAAGDVALATQPAISTPADKILQPYKDFFVFDKDKEDPWSTVAKAVYILINFEAYEDIAVHDFSPQAMSPEAAAHLVNLPTNMATLVQEMRESQKQPMLITIKFDIEKAATKLILSGTPAWAAPLADVAQGQYLQAIVSADENLLERLEFIIYQFYSSRHGKGPLERFHQKGKRWVFKEDRIITNPEVYGEYKFVRRPVFYDLKEYLTIFGVHILAEKKGLRSAAEEFEEGKHNLRVVPILDQKDRYFAFLPCPKDSTFRLSKGDKLKIKFANQAEEDTKLWTGSISGDAVTIGPMDCTPMLLIRPWYRDRRQHDQTVLNLAPATGSAGSLPASIHLNTGNRIIFEVDLTDRVHRNLLFAVEDINFEAKGKAKENWNHTIEQILPCKDHTKYEKKDIFASVRKEFGKPELIMELNDEQREAIVSMQQAPGGLAVIQGPPGTGKSKMIREISKPFLRSESVKPILIISSANAAVDSIARQMNQLLSSLQNDKLIPASRYGLRIHSIGSDNAIRDRQANASRPVDPLRRPAVFDQHIVMEELDHASQEILKIYKAESYKKFEGINDSRVSLPEMSPGAIMLQVAGIVESKHTHPDEKRFAAFRRMYRAYARNENVEVGAFEDAINEAWFYVLNHASFIVGTTTGCGFDRVVNVIKDRVRLLMLDEAAHQREDHLLPYWATRFTQLDGFVQVGDVLQLPPPCFDTLPDDWFYKQLELSFMKRLILTGFPVISLRVQHRFVEEICDMANAFVYHDRLITAEDAKLAHRRVAETFGARVTKGLLSERHNIMLIDIPKCPANKTEQTSTRSRYNDLFIIIEIIMMDRLVRAHPQATVGVITGYRGQAQRLARAHANMVAAGKPGMERVTITTMDGAQGEQYDYTIVDFLISLENSSVGFLKDWQRINVALTRARNGIILIADVNAIAKARVYERGPLARLLNHVKPYRVQWLKYDTLPKSTYYAPTDATTAV